MKTRHYHYYARKGRRAWAKGMLCACGTLWWAGLSYVAAFEGCASWAVGSACVAVFCAFGARVNFADEKANRGKAKWC